MLKLLGFVVGVLLTIYVYTKLSPENQAWLAETSNTMVETAVEEGNEIAQNLDLDVDLQGTVATLEEVSDEGVSVLNDALASAAATTEGALDNAETALTETLADAEALLEQAPEASGAVLWQITEHWGNDQRQSIKLLKEMYPELQTYEFKSVRLSSQRHVIAVTDASEADVVLLMARMQALGAPIPVLDAPVAIEQ